MTKNGNQQNTKPPMMSPKVRAELRVRLRCKRGRRGKRCRGRSRTGAGRYSPPPLPFAARGQPMEVSTGEAGGELLSEGRAGSWWLLVVVLPFISDMSVEFMEG